MYRDPRGGHNQKSFNESFFKTWSPDMAYILGFIVADGSLIDARKSSRTCYVDLNSNDKELLEQMRHFLQSSHPIQYRPARYTKIRSNFYFCKESFRLRFGSKTMFQDLVNLGITPRKSLKLKLPKMINEYLPFFLRGYFDGDGCINIYKHKNSYPPVVQIIFTSGCKSFLQDLSKKLSESLEIKNHNIITTDNAFQLKYKKTESLQLLKYVYQSLSKAPYLSRKYAIAEPFLCSVSKLNEGH